MGVLVKPSDMMRTFLVVDMGASGYLTELMIKATGSPTEALGDDEVGLLGGSLKHAGEMALS